MDILSNLALGLSVSLSPSNILYCLIGTVLGTAIGVWTGGLKMLGTLFG